MNLSGAAALHAAFARFDAAAAQTSRAASGDETQGSLETGVVAMSEAKSAASVAATVVKAQDDMLGQALDLLV